ncbi:MAG TPA: polysaccharide biosynthesis/export family protein [Bryobacteraceae bacterium]|nr:polysaccharide biosynthesis/export family protein [Bryobacteraceae bacterium]
MKTVFFCLFLAIVPAFAQSTAEPSAQQGAAGTAVHPDNDPAATVPPPNTDKTAEPATPTATPNPTPTKAEPSSTEPATPETDPAKLSASKEAEAVKMGLPLDRKAYVIGAEDVLMIHVWREPEISGQFVVRPDGRISIPLAGEVMAAGETPEQLEGAVVKGLSAVMKSPQVTVSVLQVNSKKYFIQGEVNKPGPYPLVVPTTVLEGLVNAGGFKDFANTKKITILRGKEQLKFNYKDVTHGKHLEQNILLQPGDQIIVP